MSPLADLGLRFVMTALVVVVAGTVLARGSDIIAARSSLGRLWFGSVFLALATSLPELATDMAAVRLGAVDLAVGDLFGSGLANMLILAFLALTPNGGDVLRRATLDHVLYATVAMVLTAMAAVVLLVRPPFAWAGVGIGSWALLITYAVAARLTFRHSHIAQTAGVVIEMSAPAAMAEAGGPPVGAGEDNGMPPEVLPVAPSLRRGVAMFLGAALVVLVVAPQFAASAEGIAEVSGIGRTVVGTALVGLSTSLPELVTSLAAIRLRAYDLAIGNLFGSNAINMVMFTALDPMSRTGPVLLVADPAHAITAVLVLMLMTMAVATLVFRTRRIGWIAEPGALLMLLMYVLGIGLLVWRSPN